MQFPKTATRFFLGVVLGVSVLSLSGCGRLPSVGSDETRPASARNGGTDPEAASASDFFSDEQPAEAANSSGSGQHSGPGHRTADAGTGEEQPASSPGPGRHQNRLAGETSPYLLMHAHNPVDWYPWGPEAFEAAKRQDKPIFLSIGYSSCYWCHVMERLVFENEEIAAYMNEHFINVKVDREERPDIDDIYMTALQIYLQLNGAGGGGGWPLSMFLTPEGKPIAGGTYFPPGDVDGRMGFPTIARRISDVWSTRRDQVQEGADLITRLVRKEMRPELVLKTVELDRDQSQLVTTSIVQSHDPEFGGFGFRIENPDGPKFPVPTRLALLQYEAREHDNAAAERTLYHTLDAMAAGGIRDHLAGGFHRYSTDRRWLVPHFEKMLYDNAQLADVYVEAYRATRKPLYRRVGEEILSFILEEMTDPAGGFHSAIDAETDGIEGKHYVWSREEVQKTLGQQASLFIQTYGLDRESPFEHGHVLHLPRPIEEVAASEKIQPRVLRLQLEEAREKLLIARKQREAPRQDDKILTAWNGLMIRAFANAGVVFSRQEYLAAAERALMFILTNMRDDDGKLQRTWRAGTAKHDAYLDDYAFLVEAMLTMHLATREDKWLNAARRLTDDQLSMFYDTDRGGFFFTSHGHEELLARTKNAFESVLPSGNSVSVRNLIRLSSMTGDPAYRQRAEKTLKLFAPQMEKNPRGVASLALALHEFLDNRDYRSLNSRMRQHQMASNQSSGVPGDGPTGTSPPVADLSTPASGQAEESPASRSPAGTTSTSSAPGELPTNPERENATGPEGGTDQKQSPNPKQAPGQQQAPGRQPADGRQPATDRKPGSNQRPLTDRGNQPEGKSSKARSEKKDRIKATAFLSTGRLPAGGRCRIAIVLDVAPGWHINTNPASPEFLIPTTISIRSSEGTTLQSLEFPAGEKLQVEGLPEAYHVYDGRVTLFGDLVVPESAAGGTEEFELHIRYQACDDEHCERPRTLKFAGSVPVSGLGEPVQPVNRAIFDKREQKAAPQQ